MYTTALHRPMRRSLSMMLAATAIMAPAAAASGPAADPAKGQFEQSFLSRTIDHHFMGVEMGRLCVDRSRSRRLGDICTAIVVNQSEEIVRMRDDFLLGWYGIDKHAQLAAADRKMMRDLERRRGRSFDIALSRMFIEHHEMQIQSSRTCRTSAEHHEVQHLCMDQIDTQLSEMRQFRRVLRSYGLRR